MTTDEAMRRLLSLADPANFTDGDLADPKDGEAVAIILVRYNAIAEAAVNMFSGEYDNLTSGIFPEPHFLSPEAAEKVRKLSEALHGLGYEWETLT